MPLGENRREFENITSIECKSGETVGGRECTLYSEGNELGTVDVHIFDEGDNLYVTETREIYQVDQPGGIPNPRRPPEDPPESPEVTCTLTEYKNTGEQVLDCD